MQAEKVTSKMEFILYYDLIMEVRSSHSCHFSWFRKKFLRVRRIHKAVNTSRQRYVGTIWEVVHLIC